MSNDLGTVLPEPWLRGTHETLPLVLRSVTHALELANEDIERWCGGLTDEQLNARVLGLAPVSFQLRHIARSIDRLLTYAEGRPLTDEQLAALRTELEDGGTREEVLGEWRAMFESARRRLHASADRNLDEPRSVGRRNLQTTLGGLLLHIADHTQRHVGQAITTAKVVKGSESGV